MRVQLTKFAWSKVSKAHPLPFLPMKLHRSDGAPAALQLLCATVDHLNFFEISGQEDATL